jgi:serine/threonine-protein kinase
MGTPGYMAPEQLRGEAADARSDIFALGCVLYEMLSGKKAFRRGSTAETTAAILKKDPPAMSDIGVTVPAELDRTTRRCLEKNPAARYRSASDLAYNLRSITTDQAVAMATPTAAELPKRPRAVFGVLSIAATLIAAGVAIWILRPGSVDAPGAEALPRIAVLPFENLGLAEDEYFADGMTDEVRGKLGRLAGVEVIARDSSDYYRATTKNPHEIADELGVRYLLTAKVRWQKPDDGPSRIRVSSELVDVQPGKAPVAMWQENFDATLADVFEVQTAIATRVVNELHVALRSGEQQSLDRPPTANLKAYELFLKAQELRGRGLIRQRKKELLQQAVDLDPRFAMAWANLSVVQNNIFWLEDKSPGMEVAPRISAQRALEIDPTLPEARCAMAYYFLWVHPDIERAREQVELGLEKSPNNARLLTALARVTWRNPNRWDEARAYLQRAAALDPMSTEAARLLGWNLLFMRRHAEAEEALDRALSISPDDFGTIRTRAMVMLALGDLEGARIFLRRATERVNQAEFFAYLSELYDLYWVLDSRWQELLLELDPDLFGGERAGRSLALAHIHHLRGERELTLKWAEQARAALSKQLIDFPEIPSLNSEMSVALAYLGSRDEAVAYGRKSVEAEPDAPDPYLQLQLVRIHILLGEHEPALDFLEPLLDVPFYLTPGWLSIDPMFDPLRDHPRFQALLEEYEVER